MRFFILFFLGLTTLFAAVDLNNASQKELSSLDGIGKKRAAQIIAYRKEHCFKSVDEITKIKGIGKKFLQKNRANLTVGSCKR